MMMMTSTDVMRSSMSVMCSITIRMILPVMVLFSFGACYGGGGDLSSSSYRLSSCPSVCECKGLTVECANRQLKTVPRPLPPEAKRINLEGNNISVIRSDDFAGMNQVQIMQLMENQIYMIEKGAFQDMVAMERLRLNNNKLRSLPDMLFSTMPNLMRLDLSNNKLIMIGKKTLRGAPLLKNLQMDNNEITCVDDVTIRGLKDMEILTLNKNNITTLGKDLFENMKKLRVLRISDNPFTCDCHVSWLSGWLRRNPRLGLFSKCHLPLYLANKAIAELHEFDFRCTGVGDEPPVGCSREPTCPHPCSCYDGVVDCRDKGLTRIPDHIPETATELRLEQNQIRELPNRAFANLKRLKRIDLSNNELSHIAGDAFNGLKTLTSLVLYGNKITELPNGIFRGLTSLQLLLMNANKISCVRKGTFDDLHNLNLLSLYDNNIQTLANGTFNSLHNIQTLHLARNPFICDCNLRWLAEYLHTNPIETSGARCEAPRRMHRRRISQMRESKYKCKGTEVYRSRTAGECPMSVDCPEPCSCEGTVVDCSGKKLKEIPENVPPYTTELRLNDNNLGKIKNNGIFKKLKSLAKLDLRNNELTEIEDEAFHGANQLADLLLSENKLKEVRGKMFAGLPNLTSLMLRTNLLSCVGNETFHGLESLQTLSLYDNRVTSLIEGAFDKMPALTTLNLFANPLKCNCKLQWLSQWLKKSNIVTGNPRCQAPLFLKDMPVQDVEKKDFKCTDAEKLDNVCESGPVCPLGCTCVGSVLHCSRRKLKAAPRNIPPTTTELYLDVNDIAHMPDDLNVLKDLERLDLSNNQITILPNNIVSNLTKLSTLILSYNKLQCIQVDSLLGLKSLRILSLQGNDISMIPDGAFRELVSITHIALGANPLYCDCSLRWLSDWIKKDYIEPGIARCAEPRAMKDKLVLTAPSESFVCAGKPEPEVLAKCDACYTFPCQNGATCRSRPLRDYECVCAPGYHGRNCQYIIDACYGNPCENKGTCKVLEAGRFSCHCPPGYEGDRCETNIDDCVDNKCENNATCVDLIEEYQCHCSPGYTGDYCEKKINFCSKEFNPCKNGATCIDENFTYSCACSLGFTGENCTVNIDDCIDHMCQHGGTCIDGVNSYRCQCQDGFSGAFCELENMVDLLYPQTSPCQQHDCKHGVCFMPSNAKDYVCKCSQGFTGKRCDLLSSVTFHDGSYVELEPLHTKPNLEISITFVTKQPYGVVLYNGETQHLAVELFTGRIRVSYDVGNYPVSTMFSYETISDGQTHTVELTLVKKNFTMRVDNGTARTIINDGSKEYLEVSSPLFIGGVPEEAAASALKQWHLRNTSSFDGCMRDVKLNGKPLDFMVAKKQQRITPGCADADDPCKENQCKKGKCIPLDKTSYECHCRKGWSGTYCDQAPTCQKEQYREYLEENGCRSNKMIKMANCVGSCGDQCCRPQRIKRRSVRMICANGNKYTTQVDVIRKCKCSQKC